MATFKDYKLKNGEKKWLFKTYLGKDLNGKTVQTTKRGFNTITDAKKAELQLQIDFLEKLEKEKKEKLILKIFIENGLSSTKIQLNNQH